MIKIKSEAIAIGIGSDRPNVAPRISKSFRIGLLAVASVLGVWLYWMHLRNLTHVHVAAAAAVGHAATTTAATSKPAAVAATKPQAAASGTFSMEDSAKEQVAALWTYVLQSVKAAPVAAAPKPQSTTVASQSTPAAPAVHAVAAAPKVAPKPVTDQERLLQAAQVAFQNVLDAASVYPDSYGFRADDVLQNARLGSPLAVYTVSQMDCANYKNGQPIQPLLTPGDQWVFPVTIGDRICCMVQVSHAGHNFVPGGGNKMLGLAWNKIIQKWPASQGFHPQIVVNANVPGYYFTIPELPAQNMTDIIRMFEYEQNLSPADVILASWR